MVEKLDTFRLRGRPFLAWLYTIARNLLADRYRQQARANHVPLDEALPLPDDGDGPERHTDRRLEAECLAAALAHLTEEQRQVIVLKFMENLSNGEVATLLDKSEGAIKSLQHRALAALRRAIDKEGCYETRD
jgi:RNA polymerase sigma-70 factor (ECF subfamily)